MQVVMLYHPESDHARGVEEFSHEYQRLGHGEIKLVSLETKEGAQMARLYDLVSYPAVLVATDGGVLLNSWQGDNLPLMNEVAAYKLS